MGTCAQDTGMGLYVKRLLFLSDINHNILIREGKRQDYADIEVSEYLTFRALMHFEILR
jgi:hypothetical protein